MNESDTPPGKPERWLPIVDYKGYYEVSDLGRVRSVPRVITRLGNRGRTQQIAGRVMRQCQPDKENPYLRVTLTRDGRERRVKVHVLVAEAFLGPRPAEHDVCHGPRGILDNSVANLSYGTRAKNSGPDRRRDGTSNTGSRNGRAKLTEEIVRECRVRTVAGEAVRALAREFGVSMATMGAALNGVAWQQVMPPGERDATWGARLEVMARREFRAARRGRRVVPAGEVIFAEGVCMRFAAAPSRAEMPESPAA